MGLLGDLATLVTMEMRYLRKSSWAERRHFLYDFVLGSSRTPEKKDDYLYADLHVHVRDTASVADVVDEAAKRVDIMTLVEREAIDNAGHMTFDQFIHNLDAEGVSYELLGDRVVRVETAHGDLHVIKSIEAYVTDGESRKRGIIVVGDDGSYNDWHERRVSCDEALDAIGAMNVPWFFDHPTSEPVGVPYFFMYPTDDQLALDKERYASSNAVLEVGNHQNTWWMWLANLLAVDVADELGLVGIANSDTHFNIKEIGRSRTGIPRHLLDTSSEDALLTSLKEALTPAYKDELLVERNYSHAWTFFRHMMWPNVPKIPVGLVKKVLGKERRYEDVSDLVMLCTVAGEEVAARYRTGAALRDALEQYRSTDTLVVVDIDDCATYGSPAKVMAAKYGWRKPKLWPGYVAWGLYGATVGMWHAAKNLSIKAAETKVFAAYRDMCVLPWLFDNEREELAARALADAPLCDGAKELVGYFGDAQRIVVSRNIAQVVMPVAEELDCSAGYAARDDKVGTIMQQARIRGVRRVLILGDSLEDTAAIGPLRAAGYDVAHIQVAKQYKPKKVHPDATVVITRDGYDRLNTMLNR